MGKTGLGAVATKKESRGSRVVEWGEKPSADLSVPCFHGTCYLGSLYILTSPLARYWYLQGEMIRMGKGTLFQSYPAALPIVFELNLKVVVR